MEEDLRVKSELIVGRGLRVPEGFEPPFADPMGDGTGNVIISFGGTRIRMRYSPDSGDFELRPTEGGYSLCKDGTLLADGIGFVRAFCHSPYQANVSLPKFNNIDDIMSYLDRIVSTGTVEGIPVAGGSSVDELEDVISRMHERYPDIPIGLSAEPMTSEDMRRLKDAGLSEFKITLGSTIPRIFSVLYSDGDLDGTLSCLKEAVGIFGRGKVCTGISVGMGETDEEAVAMMEELSSNGILTDLKLKRISPKNREAFESASGRIGPMDAGRLAMLGSKLKEIQGRHGLDPRTMHTLCLACRCCNLVPFGDY